MLELACARLLGTATTELAVDVGVVVPALRVTEDTCTVLAAHSEAAGVELARVPTIRVIKRALHRAAVSSKAAGNHWSHPALRMAK
jgi:hypothetical protein